MTGDGRDNPFWSALDTIHRDIALRAGDVARYPSDHAPFLGVVDAEADVAEGLDALVGAGETVLVLGVAPARLPPGWRLEPLEELAQLACEASLAVAEGPEIIALGDADHADVLALTAQVYPHYFRERTMALGRYIGIRRDGRLAAMAGERLGTPLHREVSAICTHPDFNGQGYARRLTAQLTNDTLAAGRGPFLHVSQRNVRAKALYERLGYRLRRTIPFWSLRRA